MVDVRTGRITCCSEHKKAFDTEYLRRHDNVSVGVHGRGCEMVIVHAPAPAQILCDECMSSGLYRAIRSNGSIVYSCAAHKDPLLTYAQQRKPNRSLKYVHLAVMHYRHVAPLMIACLQIDHDVGGAVRGLCPPLGRGSLCHA